MSDIIVNKVIKGDETYLDLTNDTVSEGTLLKNRTAHNSEGIQIQGVMEEGGGSVTGVKGDDESVYRDGDVNITAANIGTYTASQIDALLNNKVDAHGTDSLMTNAEHVKLAGIEAGAEENVIESISLNGEEITPVNKAVALSVIDKDVDDLTNYYKKSETDASLGAKQNIILSSALSIGGQTVTEVEEALGSLADISKPMTGATSSAAGEGGFVPSPSAGDENKALFGDGTWKPVSGGGGGHTILDEDGVTYPQRSKLQFEGLTVRDDSTNDETIVDIDPTLRDAEVIEGKNWLNPDNYAPSGTESYGVTYIVNADGSVTANGATDSSHVSGFPLLIGEGSDLQWLNGKKINGCTGGSVNTFSINVVLAQSPWTTYLSQTEDDEVISGIPNDASSIQVLIRVQKSVSVNNKVFYPMISVDGGEYEPFYIPVKDAMFRRSEQRVLGAKNLIPYPYSQTTKTASGITFTDNGDGTVTVNGTATADVFMTLFSQGGTNFILPKGSYKGSGCPSGGSDSTYQIRFQRVSSSTYIYKDKGNGVDFEFPEAQQCGVYIFIYSGATLSNVTFKPMLRLASDPDNTYVPYAMTNRELTEVKSIAYTTMNQSLYSVDTSSKVIKCGRICIATLLVNSVSVESSPSGQQWIGFISSLPLCMSDVNITVPPSDPNHYPLQVTMGANAISLSCRGGSVNETYRFTLIYITN